MAKEVKKSKVRDQSFDITVDHTPKLKKPKDVKKKKKDAALANALSEDAELGQRLRDEQRRKKARELKAQEGREALKTKSAKSAKIKKSTELALVDPTPVKKKKKVETELVVPGLDKPKRISKLKNKDMRSILGSSAESIQQLLEAGDNDNATTLLQKKMLQALVDLVPYAEQNIRDSKGKHGVYQINALMQSIREILVDVQAAQDRGALGAQLVEQVLQPMMMDIGMTVVTELEHVKGEAKTLMSVDDYKAYAQAISAAKLRIGQRMQSYFSDVREKTMQYLQG